MLHGISKIIPALAIAILGTALNSNAQYGAAQSYQFTDSSVVFTSAGGKTEIIAITDSIIKVTTIPASNRLQPKGSASVVLKRDPNVHFSISETPGAWYLSTKAVNIGINKSNSALSFMRGSTTLFAERDKLSANGTSQTMSFNTPMDETFYGGGERGTKVDLSGETLVMYNRQNYGYGRGDRTEQMNITMPYFLSSAGYGVFFDDYAKAELALSEPLTYTTTVKNPISYYFMLGEENSMLPVIRNFTALTGRQELPPFWTLGYITSKYGYRNQAETLGVIDTLKTQGYPVDGIVLDLYWYGQESDMGRFQWAPKQWSNPDSMIRALKDLGVNLVTISQPYLNKIGAIDNYNMAAAKGMLVTDSVGNVHDVTTWVGEAGMLDVTNPATRQWMWEQYKKSLNQGVAGLWGDLGEPEVHPSTIYHSTGEKAEEYHNRYGNDWSNIIYNGMKKEYPDRRPMLLMRGGTAGLQRYSVFPWSTDVGRSWGGLQAQIPIMINSSISGLGYMSNDVGGFAVDPANPVNPELYMRWLQLGLFIPTLRTHSTVDAEPYHYTQPGYQEIMKRIIRDRYRWLPYNYTLAYLNTTTGAPMVRPMNFNDPQNKALSNINDQYFWGDEVIVAPVLEAGKTSREVVLPAGTWYDYNNPEKQYSGPATVTVDAPISTIPLFVRAGSFLPSAEYPMENTGDYDTSRYTITYYPGDGKSSYTMFEDDRVSTGSLKDGAYLLYNFSANNTNRKIEIDVAITGKGYRETGEGCELTFVIPCVGKPKYIEINGGRVVETSNKNNWIAGSYMYDATTSTLRLKTFIDTTLKINLHK